MSSQGKRELAEAVLAGLNARDFAALAELPWHPEMEFHSVLAAFEGEMVYHGIEGLREWAKAADSAFDDFRSELVAFREIDDERVLLTVRATGRARASGVPIDTLLAQIWTWRSGKMWRNQVFTDPRDALEAAGLPE